MACLFLPRHFHGSTSIFTRISDTSRAGACRVPTTHRNHPSDIDGEDSFHLGTLPRTSGLIRVIG